jgi:hypothetical protein
MRVLLLMWSVNYDRLFEAALRELLARGHTIHVAFETDKEGRSGDTRLFESLRSEYPGLSWSAVPRRQEHLRTWWRRQLRLSIDLLRYLEPEYAEAHALRDRALTRAPRLAAALARTPLNRSARLRSRAGSALRRAEASLPPDPAVTAFIEEHAPDVVAVTPLVMLGSAQGEYVRAARALGLPSAFLVASWDNLTNKGVVHDEPDLTVVWNEAQRREAVALHGLREDSVVATGAHSYDHWFDWSESRARDGFCAELGLDPARPLLLYACSSKFIAPDEILTVRRWIERVRAAQDPLLREASIIVRPHPANPQPWAEAGIEEAGRTVVWPSRGTKPTDSDAKRDYYDSLFHAAAVIGINTSALVESAILGRPSYTLLEPELQGGQEGTLHFAHLAALHVARTPGEHEEQLLEALRGSAGDERQRAFVQSFLRPHGIDVPAAPRLADELEALAARGPRTRVLLFVLDHPGFLLHFDETIGALAARGHTVHVAFARPEKWPHGLEAIDRTSPRIVVHDEIPRRVSLARVSRGVRRLADYVHYLDPRLEDAAYSRAKWRGLARFPGPLAVLRRRETLPRPVVGALLRALAAAERAIPVEESVERFVAGIGPDAVVVSPLVDGRTDLTDYVRAARRLGIPSALSVASWDNLSSKGLVRVPPDRVFVWNETQRREAVDYHRLPPSRIAVTGAQPYDRWFGRRPATTPAQFAERRGLPGERRVILFAGSTKQDQAAGLEPRFVRAWIEALRSSGRPEVAEAAILVRPHQTNEAAWREADLGDLADVAVWRRERGLPVTDEDRAEYFDALHHASAVVAINSTALIEATILDRPAHSVALPELRSLQHDLLHYHYMLPENGGFLREAHTLEEHAQLLADDIASPEAFADRRRSFVGSFIRPQGLAEPSTPRLVAELERLAHDGRRQ